MKKWDGHTHSEFCRHGSGQRTALMVEKAIDLGFQCYSITEHAPLPDGIIPDAELGLEFTLMADEVEDYFEHIKVLKRIYGHKIDILSGLEVDYLPGFEKYTNEVLESNRDNLDDVIVSMHFLKGKDGFRAVDYKPEDFEEGLVEYYGSVEEVHRVYWETMEKMVLSDFDALKTRRIGHIGLIYKFLNRFPLSSSDMESVRKFEKLFHLIKKREWAIDFNVAGMVQKDFQNVYLTKPMVSWCRKLEIELVYGSDAHGVDTIGHFYDAFITVL
ncbi:MAG: histidinol-phosphatase HisJ [Proteobacteria bacterium]|nr:histidinol-phosphatase HisJ [Pseudomonadota bacterium]